MQKFLTGAVVIALLVLTLTLWTQSTMTSGASNDGIRVIDAGPASTPWKTSEVAASFASATLTSATIVAESRSDKMLGWMGTDSENDPSALAAQLRREPRDDAWATHSEKVIEAQLSRIPYLGGGEPLRITCGSMVCEAAGSFAKDLPSEGLNVATEAMRATTLRDALQADKLMSGAQTYNYADGPSTFTLYFMRAAQ